MLDDDVWRYLPLGPTPTVVAVLVGSVLLVVISLRPSLGARRLGFVLVGVTAMGILAVTLGRGEASFGPSFNLRPGAGIRAELENLNHALGVANIVGNVVLFVPLGWLVAVLVLGVPAAGLFIGLRWGVLAGLLLSLTIEV